MWLSYSVSNRLVSERSYYQPIGRTSGHAVTQFQETKGKIRRRTMRLWLGRTGGIVVVAG